MGDEGGRVDHFNRLFIAIRVFRSCKRPSRNRSDMTLLNDDQVQSFINSGFIEISLPELDSVHSEVNSRLREICAAESHHGNNVLPRIPLLQQVLRQPKIHGALVSLLGSDYLVHPHRAIHRSTPLKEALDGFSLSSDRHLMGAGSTATSMWHQDAQSPLARARHHVPKFLVGFYFPHDVIAEMGPTRFLRASHCDNGPDLSRSIYQPEHVRAGTFFLAHFDIAHAGFPNVSNDDRFMLKFVFARTSQLAKPTWSNERDYWSVDSEDLVDAGLYEPAASFIWNRMRGKTNNEQYAESSKSRLSNREVPQEQRLRLIYGGVDGLSLNDCVAAFNSVQGEKKHERLHKNLRDSTHGHPVRWNERAVVMETAAYRLAFLGQESADAICSFIKSNDPWLQINAAFAAGEIGVNDDEFASNLFDLLQSPYHQVVRQAIDAITFMKVNNRQRILRQLKDLVLHKRPGWQTPLVQRGWSASDQIDMNIAMFLLANCMQLEARDLIDISSIMLQKSNDYALSIVAEALVRSGDPIAQKHAIEYLKNRAWNTSLLGAERAY